MIELRTHDGFPGGSLRSDWEQLVVDDPDATIFHTPRFLELWHRELGQGVQATVRTAHRDGRLVGVIPECHQRTGSPTGPIELRSFLGREDVTDYRGPVGRPEDRDDIVAAYVRALSEDVDWDELMVAGVPAGTGWIEAFERHAGSSGLDPLERIEEDVCPRVTVAGGYDRYLRSLPGRLRQEIKRKARKLARDAGEVALVAVPSSDVVDRLDDFFAMAHDSDADKRGFFAKDELRHFFRTLAGALAPDGIFRLHFLDVAGKSGAATVSLVHSGEWGLYNSAFDQTLAMLAPGLVLVTELIREAADGGCQVFDLLRGDEPYKYRFGAQDRPVERLTIARS